MIYSNGFTRCYAYRSKFDTCIIKQCWKGKRMRGLYTVRSELFRDQQVQFLTQHKSLHSLQIIDRQWTYLTRWKLKKHHAQQFSGKQTLKKIAPGILWYWQFKTGLVIAGDMVPWIILYLLGRVCKVLGSSEKHTGYVDQGNLYSSCISESTRGVHQMIGKFLSRCINNKLL